MSTAQAEGTQTLSFCLLLLQNKSLLANNEQPVALGLNLYSCTEPREREKMGGREANGEENTVESDKKRRNLSAKEQGGPLATRRPKLTEGVVATKWHSPPLVIQRVGHGGSAG